jgi:hypothetical protein
MKNLNALIDQIRSYCYHRIQGGETISRITIEYFSEHTCSRTTFDVLAFSEEMDKWKEQKRKQEGGAS